MKDPLLNEILKAELDRKKDLDRGFDMKYIDSIRRNNQFQFMYTQKVNPNDTLKQE